MNVNELLQVLWRRKMIVGAITALAIGIAVAALQLVKPEYESTTTLALSPTNVQNGLIMFGILDSVVPVYADAATSHTTLSLARPQSPYPLGTVRVQTFQGTPIIKVTGRSTSKFVARDTANAVTAALLKRVRSHEVGVASIRLTELDRATLATAPVFPKKKLTLIVAALLGLAFGVGAAFLRENLATKIETPEELERLAGSPVFGQLPTEPAVTRLRSAEALSEDTRLRAFSEALRDLRTNLLFAEGNPGSIVLTSPQGSHGKTTVSFGLAATLARAGTRTLLIDADLRRGRLAEMLDLPRTPGLVEVLTGTPVEEVIQHTSLETLDIITGGRRGGDPVELLTSEFPALLNHLESIYETVVIDATPLVPISDARIIARFAAATLIVASAGNVTRRQVRTAVERLSLIGARATALVLNNYHEPGATTYYGMPENEPSRRRTRRQRESSAS